MRSLSTMSVTSMRPFSTISVTPEGRGDGGWVQISALIFQHFLSVRVSQNKTINYWGYLCHDLRQSLAGVCHGLWRFHGCVCHGLRGGGVGGGSKCLPLYFNTSFQFVFRKRYWLYQAAIVTIFDRRSINPDRIRLYYICFYLRSHHLHTKHVLIYTRIGEERRICKERIIK
jgi:hypothetical protein